jgi:hypothetical protein
MQFHPMQLNYAHSGAALIEGSPAYKSKHTRARQALDIASLWNPEIAYALASKIAQEGYPLKARREAREMCECVCAAYSLRDDKQSCGPGGARFKRKDLPPIRLNRRSNTP